MAYKTGNPALSTKTFEGLGHASGAPMTLNGAVSRTIMLLGVLIASAAIGWLYLAAAPVLVLPLIITALVIAIVLAFKKSWAPFLAPVYAVLQGGAVGIISRLYEAQYSGIVVMAIGLTLSVAAVMLGLYLTQIIKATENFKLVVFSATLGIAFYYLISLALGFFGIQAPLIHDSGPIGIGFSLFVVGIAALNLVMDFDFIEQGAEQGAPKYMEWYAAFGLLVTLVWLYLEILRLLAKTRD